jgi:hypothetical protein
MTDARPQHCRHCRHSFSRPRSKDGVLELRCAIQGYELLAVKACTRWEMEPGIDDDLTETTP